MFAPLAGASGLSSSTRISFATSPGVRPGRSSIGLTQHLCRLRQDSQMARCRAVYLHRDVPGEADDPVLGDVVCRQPRTSVA
jgi:hypothetical protein